MTLLSYDALLAAMDHDELDERLIVTPLLDEEQVGPASIDLRLDTEFLLPAKHRGSGIDPGAAPVEADAYHATISVPLGESLWIHPQQFILGSTLEFIRLPSRLGAYVLGRSSWGRVGLLIATAVMVQPGYAGSLTLELTNEGDAPIRLYPGLRVAQLAVHSLIEPTTRPYARASAKYLAPTGPQASRAAWDQHEVETLMKVRAALSKTTTT